MESFLNRYRNITVLLLVIFAQLILLALQVKNDQDVYLIRVWTVTAVTPMARILDGLRGGSTGFVRNYILLHRADADNRRLQAELDRLKLENITLKNQLNQADRAQALQLFRAHTPSKTLAATVIAMGAGWNSKVVFVDRGSVEGVMRGMAVVTPEGIVGKVIAAYPTASQVLLITDQDFAAGVVSRKGQARGTLKGQGTPLCRVDYVPLEEKIEPGEWFYTSGDDRIFPRGFPVGVVKAVHSGQPFQEILVEPAGLQRGLEDVLILIDPVHQEIPAMTAASQPVYIAPPPPNAAAGSSGAEAPASPQAAPAGTEADKLRSIYKAAGDAQGHTFGEGLPGSKPPDFTKLPGQGPGGVPAAVAGRGPGPVQGPGTPGRGTAGVPAAVAGREQGPGGVPAAVAARGQAPAVGSKPPFVGPQPPDAGRHGNQPTGQGSAPPPAARGPAQVPASAPPFVGPQPPDAGRHANPPAGRGPAQGPAAAPSPAAPKTPFVGPKAPDRGRHANPPAGRGPAQSPAAAPSPAAPKTPFVGPKAPDRGRHANPAAGAASGGIPRR